MSGTGTEKLRIDIPIIVEGKYDKIKLMSLCEADIFTTDGFAVFNSREKLALFRKLAARRGIIILTDSDGAGACIRRYLLSAVPPDRVYNLHIPRVEGKERRKRAPSAEGIVGVEGTDAALLRTMLARFAGNGPPKRAGITKADFFAAGLSGAKNSAALRDRLAAHFELPAKMTANALLSALNILTDADGFAAAAAGLTGGTENNGQA